MIITKSAPYTTEEIQSLKECFDVYIKTVIDLQRKICSAGCDRHFESEKILSDNGSSQSDVWGGGFDSETRVIDTNSFINIRPNDGNTSNEIQDLKKRKMFEALMRYFFKEAL